MLQQVACEVASPQSPAFSALQRTPLSSKRTVALQLASSRGGMQGVAAALAAAQRAAAAARGAAAPLALVSVSPQLASIAGAPTAVPDVDGCGLPGLMKAISSEAALQTAAVQGEAAGKLDLEGGTQLLLLQQGRGGGEEELHSREIRWVVAHWYGGGWCPSWLYGVSYTGAACALFYFLSRAVVQLADMLCYVFSAMRHLPPASSHTQNRPCWSPFSSCTCLSWSFASEAEHINSNHVAACKHLKTNQPHMPQHHRPALPTTLSGLASALHTPCAPCSPLLCPAPTAWFLDPVDPCAIWFPWPWMMRGPWGRAG